MERLTERDEYGNADVRGVRMEIASLALTFTELNNLTNALNRLAAYEDTGFTPEEISQQRFFIAALKDPEKLARLRDIVLADEAGRLVVLPCKVGDTVYRVFSVKDREPVVVPCEIKTVGQAADLVGKIAEKGWMLSTYLTREEAEEAMRKENQGDA